MAVNDLLQPLSDNNSGRETCKSSASTMQDHYTHQMEFLLRTKRLWNVLRTTAKELDKP